MSLTLSSCDGVAAARARVRVLIIEDDEDTAETTGKLLEMRHYVVEIVTNGAQALPRLAAFSPDIVLLDLGLPEVSGYEIAKQIRAQSGFEKLPIIAVTGYGDHEHKARSASAGIDQHLVKPVLLDTLEDAFSRAMNHSSTRRQTAQAGSPGRRDLGPIEYKADGSCDEPIG